MRGPTSIQRRLGIGLAVGVTVMWILATLGAGLIVSHELDEAFDSALQETAQRLLPLAVLDIVEREEMLAVRRVSPLGEHEELLTYVVRDRAGNVLLHSHDADLAVFPMPPAVGYRNTQTHRLYGESAVSGSLVIQVAEPLEHRREASFEAASALFLPLAFLMPLGLIVAGWFVRRSMRPVRAFKAEIETRGGGDLSPVATEGLPAEISPIADAVNLLMERLRRVLEAERNFTTNSAHELRTPIAATLAQTQRLIAEAPEGGVRDRARQIESSLRQLGRLSEKLMQLARAEGGGLLAETPQDLGPVLALVVEEFRRGPAGGPDLRLSLPGEDAFSSPMDPDAFAILMRNLIENALKHGQAGTPVEIAMSGDGIVRVVNAGPLVPPETLARLKGRFERGSAEAQGSGLGLAIADTIASGAGARLDLISPATGRKDGFKAVLRLPR